MIKNLPQWVKFAMAIVAQLAIVFGLIFVSASVLISGVEVVLPIEPVDPRDWIRGDYITVDYSISRIDKKIVGSQKFENNKTVYVSLEKQGDVWSAVAVSSKRPAGGVFINGAVKYARYSGDLQITYGIEDYFIPEGSGADLNQQLTKKDAFARVVVDKNGNAVLKEIFFKNK